MNINTSTKKMILNYYKTFLSSAKKLESYNFKDHTVRKIRHDFRSKFYILNFIKFSQ